MTTITTTSAADWTETQLLHRMLLRQGVAWREFHRRYDRLIYRCIHKVTSRFPGCITSEDVREIYAMFLLSLNKRKMHKLRTFDPERGNKLSSWIGMLATNCAWDYLRSVARQPQTTDLADAEQIGTTSDSPFDDLLEKERWAVVNSVLQGFSQKDRVFVRLYYVDGLSPEEIADQMAISVKTVYSKKHKIRCRLQKALEPVVEAAA
ncbi:MAG TPA: sigma-70 family RNA polymerase sigma factor [Sandaracinaceae bacterium LLY-WYZ-13_1]|nr:sigma-70 family RNA polymerase sigma factor [Sandaracinaceae bacterium LLY-WYZ-13_1]